ncbi:hypothetical protein ACE5NI_18380 [Clostridioides difficile]
MITNLYKDKNENECVDICEVLYNLLNQVYKFTNVIIVREIKDIAKISNTNDFKKSIYVDVSNYAGSKRTVLRRLNLEAFVNINTTIVTIVPTSLLKFVSNNCSNVEVEYIPNILKLADTEIEVEDNLCIVTFNYTDDKENYKYEY